MSDMEKVWVFACVIVVVIKPYLSNEVRQDELSSWSKASENCGNDGLEFNESILKGFDVLHGKTFWIGKAIYKRTLDWIEILGCYEVKDPTEMTVLRETTSVAECQLKCNSSMPVSPLYFGYNEETSVCICARNIPTYTAVIQDCADKNFSNAYFFYQVYTRNEISGQEGGHCTTLQCLTGNNHLQAFGCSASARGKCGNAAFKWALSYSDSLNWCRSKGQLLLVPSTYCLTHENEGIKSWTNVFREVYHSQLTKAEVGNEIPFKCLSGQLVNYDGELKLNEKKRDCSEGLHWYVCRNATVQSIQSTSTEHVPSKSRMTSNKTAGTTLSPAKTQSTTSTSTEYVTSKSLMTSNKTTGTTLSPAKTQSTTSTSTKYVTSKSLMTSNKTTGSTLSPAITQSTTSTSTEYGTAKSLMTSNKTAGTTLSPGRISSSMYSTASPGVTNSSVQAKQQMEESEKRSNSKTIGAVIGGLLGACSVIALLAVLIVCKVRSIGFFKELSKHKKEETSQMEFSKATYQDSNNTTDIRSTTTTSNQTYGLAGNSTAVYAVVNKIKTPGIINDTYTDAGYGQYDHLHDIQNRRISPQENLYHCHGASQNEEDQTYDSSDFGKGKSYEGNGVYDQSFLMLEGEYSYSTNKNHDNTNNMGIYDKAS